MSSSSKKMVTLKTSDGELFVVDEAVAVMRSPVIKSLLLDSAASNTTPLLVGVDGKTMAKVSEHWKKHSEVGGLTEEQLKDFDEDFLKVPNFVLYDVLIAANSLGDKELVSVISQEVADRMADKTTEEIREEFNIQNDFTPEEEEEIRQRLGL